MNGNARIVYLVNLVLILTAMPTWAVVDTRDIDAVREKRVLNDQDLSVIDAFMKDAIQELVYTRDFSSVSKTRAIILSRRTASAQYNQKFSDSAHTYITQGFQQAQELDPARCNRVQMNLLVLVYRLADARLIDIAFDWTEAQSAPVRFWAYRVLTGPVVVELVNQGSQTTLTEQILTHLRQGIKAGNPDILDLIISFVGQLSGDTGRDLLNQIVAQRFDVYEHWSVQSPLLDGQVLRILCQHIEANGDDRLECARHFTQLYSYVIQALIQGQSVLKEAVLGDLTAVTVDVEDKCLTGLLGRAQTTLKRAAEKSDMDAIQAEHDRLLGTATTRGELPQALQINYGSLPDGRERTQPKTLPPAP